MSDPFGDVSLFSCCSLEITWKNNIFQVSGCGLGSVFVFEKQLDMPDGVLNWPCGSEQSSDVSLFGSGCAINSSHT